MLAEITLLASGLPRYFEQDHKEEQRFQNVRVQAMLPVEDWGTFVEVSGNKINQKSFHMTFAGVVVCYGDYTKNN